MVDDLSGPGAVTCPNSLRMIPSLFNLPNFLRVPDNQGSSIHNQMSSNNASKHVSAMVMSVRPSQDNAGTRRMKFSSTMESII